MAPKLRIKFWCDANLVSQKVDFLGGKLDRIGQNAEKVGKGLTGVLTAPLTALALPAIAAADGLSRAQAAIRAQTGATGESLKALVGVFQQVRGDTGASVDDASKVVIEFSRGLGLTGEKLRQASDALIKTARASGADLGSAASSVAKLANAWHVDSGSVASLIGTVHAASRGAQGGFVGVAGALTLAAPVMRAVNLSLEQTVALLEQLVRAGVPFEQAMDGIKQAVAKLAQGGFQDLGAEFARQLEAIRSAASPADAARAAIALFGESGLKLADAIRKGSFKNAIAGLGAMPSTEAVTTLARQWEMLKEKLSTAIAPLGTAIVNSMLKLEPLARDLIGFVTKAVDAFAHAPQWVIDFVVYGAGLVASIGPALIAIGASLAPLARFAAGMLKRFGLIPSIDIAFASAQTGATVAAAALAVAGAAMVGGAEAGPIATKAIESAVKAQPPVQISTSQIGRDWPAPPVLRSLPPVPVLRASVTAPAIHPPQKVMTVPDLAGGDQVGSVYGGVFDWQSGYRTQTFDWQRQFADALTRSSTIPSAIPPAPQFFGPKAGQSLGDAYREFAGQMAIWYSQMAQVGAMPIGPIMPGSWLDANRPEEWLRRAAEVDRLVRDSEDRTSFYRAAAEERDRLAARAAEERNFANNMAFRNPTIVTVSDIVEAAQAAIASAKNEADSPALSVDRGGSASPPPSTRLTVGYRAPGPDSPGRLPGSATRENFERLLRRGASPEDALNLLAPGHAIGRSAVDTIDILFPGLLESVKVEAPNTSTVFKGPDKQFYTVEESVQADRLAYPGEPWPAGTPLTSSGAAIFYPSQIGGIAPSRRSEVVFAQQIIPPKRKTVTIDHYAGPYDPWPIGSALTDSEQLIIPESARPTTPFLVAQRAVFADEILPPKKRTVRIDHYSDGTDGWSVGQPMTSSDKAIIPRALESSVHPTVRKNAVFADEILEPAEKKEKDPAEEPTQFRGPDGKYYYSKKSIRADHLAFANENGWTEGTPLTASGKAIVRPADVGSIPAHRRDDLAIADEILTPLPKTVTIDHYAGKNDPWPAGTPLTTDEKIILPASSRSSTSPEMSKKAVFADTILPPKPRTVHAHHYSAGDDGWSFGQPLNKAGKGIFPREMESEFTPDQRKNMVFADKILPPEDQPEGGAA